YPCSIVDPHSFPTRRSSDLKLLLDGYYANNTDYKLNADLENLVLSKIIPRGILGNLKIDGIANGNVNVVRTVDEFKPLAQLKIRSEEHTSELQSRENLVCRL